MPIHPIYRIWAFGRAINPWSGEESNVNGQALFYNARAITVVEGTIARGTAPGAGNELNLKTFVGDVFLAGSTTGSDVDLVNPNLTVRGTIGGSWPASTDATNAEGRHLQMGITNAPVSDDTFVGLLYEDTADASINYFGWGDREFNLGSGIGAGVSAYTTFGISDFRATTESFVQLPWPAGTFKHLAMVYAVGAGGADVTLELRVNGTAQMTKTLSDTAGAKTLLTDTSTEVTTAAGDLVSWRFVRADTALFTCTLTIGFTVT
jgi:hypothetical protein